VRLWGGVPKGHFLTNFKHYNLYLSEKFQIDHFLGVDEIKKIWQKMIFTIPAIRAIENPNINFPKNWRKLIISRFTDPALMAVNLEVDLRSELSQVYRPGRTTRSDDSRDLRSQILDQIWPSERSRFWSDRVSRSDQIRTLSGLQTREGSQIWRIDSSNLKILNIQIWTDPSSLRFTDPRGLSDQTRFDQNFGSDLRFFP